MLSDKKNIILVVACALVDADRRILISQRPSGKSSEGKWEFPGGKIEKGETPELAIIRELEEELGISTKSACLAPLAFASHSYEDFHLLMPLYVCRKWDGQPYPKEKQELKWLKARDLYKFDMLEADKPLISHLCDLL